MKRPGRPKLPPADFKKRKVVRVCLMICIRVRLRACVLAGGHYTFAATESSDPLRATTCVSLAMLVVKRRRRHWFILLVLGLVRLW